MVLIINKKTKKAEIDAFLKKAEQRASKKNSFNPEKYLGKVKSFKNIDPIKLQRQMRNEW